MGGGGKEGAKGDDFGGLSGDQGAVGVGDKAGVSVAGGVGDRAAVRGAVMGATHLAAKCSALVAWIAGSSTGTTAPLGWAMRPPKRAAKGYPG